MITRKKEFIKITDKRYKEQDKLLKNMITILNKNKDKYQGQKIITEIIFNTTTHYYINKDNFVFDEDH